jgi:hypothetical protein
VEAAAAAAATLVVVVAVVVPAASVAAAASAASVAAAAAVAAVTTLWGIQPRHCKEAARIPLPRYDHSLFCCRCGLFTTWAYDVSRQGDHGRLGSSYSAVIDWHRASTPQATAVPGGVAVASVRVARDPLAAQLEGNVLASEDALRRTCETIGQTYMRMRALEPVVAQLTSALSSGGGSTAPSAQLEREQKALGDVRDMLARLEVRHQRQQVQMQLLMLMLSLSLSLSPCCCCCCNTHAAGASSGASSGACAAVVVGAAMPPAYAMAHLAGVVVCRTCESRCCNRILQRKTARCWSSTSNRLVVELRVPPTMISMRVLDTASRRPPL